RWRARAVAELKSVPGSQSVGLERKRVRKVKRAPIEVGSQGLTRRCFVYAGIMFIGCRLILLPLMLGMACVSGLTQFPGAEATDQIKPTLVAETTEIEAGKPFTLGVRFEIKNTWYTYWRFVGDIGMPLEVVWELPAGFKAGPLQWPFPVSHAAAGDFL